MVDFEKKISLMARSQLPKGFEIWKNKPLVIESLKYTFPYKKSEKKSVVKQGLEVPKMTKPDLTDNLNKALLDALEGLVFDNDSRIYKIQNSEKVYGSESAINLIISIGDYHGS